jgi:hypothetical protein
MLYLWFNWLLTLANVTNHTAPRGGARAQPGPDKIAPRGRNFASYPLLVLFMYYKISLFCKSISIVYPSKSTRMNFSALAK